MVKLPKHPLYLSNFHFGPFRGPSCNFPPKISQSEKHSSEVHGLAQMVTLGMQMTTSSGVGIKSLSPWRPRTTNGDQKGDVDVTREAKWEYLG